MYPSLQETQAWAQSAAADTTSQPTSPSLIASSSTPFFAVRNSHSVSSAQEVMSPPNSHRHHHSHGSIQSRQGLYTNGQARTRTYRPVSRPPYVNAVRYHNSYGYGGPHDSPASMINSHKVTHIFYSFAAVDYDGTVRLGDERADLEIEVDGVKGCLNACLDLRNRSEHAPPAVILSIGGPGGSEAFPWIASDTGVLRRKFFTSLNSLVLRYELDGIDVFWDRPQTEVEGELLLTLLAGLRGIFKDKNKIITVTFPAEQDFLQRIRLGQLLFFVDFLNVQANEFVPRHLKQSGFHAQLLTPSLPSLPPHLPSCQSIVEYILSKHFPISKVILAVDCYGRQYVGAQRPWENCLEVKDIPFHSLPSRGSVEGFDAITESAFCVTDKSWISYDSPTSVQAKARFVKLKGLAGLCFTRIDGDKDGAKSLVYTGSECLH